MKSLAKRLSYLLGCTFAFLIFHPHMLGSETLQITTYYPAPYGGYVRMLTTDTTILARDGGKAVMGTLANPIRRVLDVNGDIHIFGSLNELCTTIAYSIGSGASCRMVPPINSHKLVASVGNGVCINQLDNALHPVTRVCNAGGIMMCCRVGLSPGNSGW